MAWTFFLVVNVLRELSACVICQSVVSFTIIGSQLNLHCLKVESTRPLCITSACFACEHYKLLDFTDIPWSPVITLLLSLLLSVRPFSMLVASHHLCQHAHVPKEKWKKTVQDFTLAQN